MFNDQPSRRMFRRLYRDIIRGITLFVGIYDYVATLDFCRPGSASQEWKAIRDY